MTSAGTAAKKTGYNDKVIDCVKGADHNAGFHCIARETSFLILMSLKLEEYGKNGSKTEK